MRHDDRLTHWLAVGVLLGVIAAQAEAQTPSKPPPPSPAPQPAVAPPPPPSPQPPPGQPVNIRIELVLSDTVEGKTIANEIFTSLLADGQVGKMRRFNSDNTRAFEVDVRPLMVGSRVQLTLTMNYRAPGGPTGEDKSLLSFTQNIASFLENGKPLTVIESKGDPVSSRRIAVQATATIMK